MQRTITLHWTDLISSSDLPDRDQKYTGVYIWGFSIDDVFTPYYVGIADDMIFRIFEHISSILSGRYTIYHRDSLANFKEYKSQSLQEDRREGKIYNPNWPDKFKDFLDHRKELQSHIDYMIEAFAFSYAKIDRNQFSRQDLKEVEKICINQIGIDKLANTRAGYSDGFLVEHVGNPIIMKIFKG